MDTLKKPFVAPSVTVEASLEDVTLVSGGGGRRHGKKHGNNHNNNHNNHNNNRNNGHRGS